MSTSKWPLFETPTSSNAVHVTFREPRGTNGNVGSLGWGSESEFPTKVTTLVGRGKQLISL